MPDVRVLNELQIKKNGVVATYRLRTVNGYYNPTDGKFYEEVTHVTEIEGAPNLVYADISGNTLYIYKTSTSSFVQVSGSGGGLNYVDTLPSPPNIKDAIYGYYSTEDFIETVAIDFLDENDGCNDILLLLTEFTNILMTSQILSFATPIQTL